MTMMPESLTEYWDECASQGILSRVVLDGELAVPCTCNPLQQG